MNETENSKMTVDKKRCVRRWMWNRGRLQDMEFVWNAAKLKNDGEQNLEKAITARIECIKRGWWRWGHVAWGGEPGTGIPDEARNCWEEKQGYGQGVENR